MFVFSLPLKNVLLRREQEFIIEEMKRRCGWDYKPYTPIIVVYYEPSASCYEKSQAFYTATAKENAILVGVETKT